MKPESFEPFPRRPAPVSGATPGLWAATLAEAKICLGYAALILVAAGSGGAAADLARRWIAASSTVTEAVLILVPVPDASIASPFELALYRHILAASILFTATAFLAFRHRWASWRRCARMIVEQMPRDRETPGEVMQAGLFQTGLGAAATFLLMLYGDQRLGALTEALYAQSWTFLRAPLLAILAFALACHAAALRPESHGEAGGT